PPRQPDKRRTQQQHRPEARVIRQPRMTPQRQTPRKQPPPRARQPNRRPQQRMIRRLQTNNTNIPNPNPTLKPKTPPLKRITRKLHPPHTQTPKQHTPTNPHTVSVQASQRAEQRLGLRALLVQGGREHRLALGP